jgi:PqqD family protein of HPr-rel-A system
VHPSNPLALVIWAPVDPGGLRRSLWQLDNAVFHAETGETHLLSELPTFLVEILAAGALSTAQICEHAAEACGAADNETWRENIAAVLERLEGLELVERRAAPFA